MARGGARPGAGRKPGKPAVKLARAIINDAVERGETPLQYFLSVMTDPNATVERKDWAAAEAAPFCHPRLNAVAVQATVTTNTRAEELSDDALAAIACSSSTDAADTANGKGKPH